MHATRGFQLLDSRNPSEEKTASAPLWTGSISQICYVLYLTLWNYFCGGNVCGFIRVVNSGQNPLSDRK